MVEVPDFDQEPKVEENVLRFEEIELRSLDADARSRENLNREADQRFHFRNWAVILTSTLIFLFIILAFHIVMNLEGLIEKNAAPIVVVGLYAVPIAAIVTLTVSLMLAAFRGSKDGDETTAAKASVNGTRIGALGS